MPCFPLEGGGAARRLLSVRAIAGRAGNVFARPCGDRRGGSLHFQSSYMHFSNGEGR